MKMDELMQRANRSPYLLRSTTSLPDDLLSLLPCQESTGGSTVVSEKLSPLSAEGQLLMDELNDLCNGEKKPVPATSTKRKLAVTQMDTDEKENTDGNLRFTKTPGKRRQRIMSDNMRKLDALCDTPTTDCQNGDRENENADEFKASPSKPSPSPLQDLSQVVEKKRASRFASSKLRPPQASGLRALKSYKA
jgi:hypothetical protein